MQKYRLYLRKLENNEVDNSSKFPSQSLISLDVTKDNDSSGCPYIGEEMSNEVFQSKENVIRPQPQFEELEQALSFSNFSHMNGQLVQAPILSGQLSDIIVDGNDNVVPVPLIPLINGTSIGSSQDFSNNCLYLKILEEYEQMYQSQISENLRVSNNRSFDHSIGEDYFINPTRLSAQVGVIFHSYHAYINVS